MLDFIKTTEDVNSALAVIDILLAAEYKVGKKIDIADFSASEHHIYTQLADFLAETPDFSLNKLREDLTKLEKVEVVLAFDAAQDFISTLYEHVKDLVNVPFVLEIQIDSSIIGGVILNYVGLHKDLSVKKKLNQYNFSRLIKEVIG